MRGLEKRFEVVYHSTGLSLPRRQDIPAVQSLSKRSEVEMTHTYTLVNDTAERHLPTPLSQTSSSTESEADSVSTPPSSHGDPDRTLVLDFVRGEEMKIQAAISILDPSQPRSVLLVADSLSGDAAYGFTRALRKEYRTWTIRVATFEASWTDAQRTEAAQELLALDTDEVEMVIDADGSILIPRVEVSDPPLPLVPLSLDKPWKMEHGKVVQAHLPYPVEDHVVVAISGVTANDGRLWTFVGKSDDYPQPVVGISIGSYCSHLQVHKGSIVEMEESSISSSDVGSYPPILAATIVALAVGCAAFDHKERLRGARVLVVETKSGVGSDIRDVCAGLGMEAMLITSLDDEQLKTYYLNKPQIILSDVRDAPDVGLVRSILDPRRGRAFFWDHAEEGIESTIANDPWAIGDALRSALQYHASRHSSSIPYSPPSKLIGSTASLPVELFDPRKSYLLIGGIGSLGLYIALWMYEVSVISYVSLHVLTQTCSMEQGMLFSPRDPDLRALRKLAIGSRSDSCTTSVVVVTYFLRPLPLTLPLNKKCQLSSTIYHTLSVDACSWLCSSTMACLHRRRKRPSRACSLARWMLWRSSSVPTTSIPSTS